MSWTTTWPTDVGWYWMFDPAIAEMSTVRAPVAGTWINGHGGFMYPSDRSTDVYWLPLAQPEPPTTKKEK